MATDRDARKQLAEQAKQITVLQEDVAALDLDMTELEVRLDALEPDEPDEKVTLVPFGA